MVNKSFFEKDDGSKKLPSYSKMFNLSGKVAVVTGGAGVLGRYFCAGLSESGAHVAVVDVDTASACELAAELTQLYGVRSIGYTCDVTDCLSVRNMVNAVVADFGKINILHNNAAGKSQDLNAFFAPFEEYSIEKWREIMTVNIDGMFLVAQAVGNQFLKQGKGGSIIQTSSIYGVVAPDQRIYEDSFYLGRQINTPAVYSASKAAVIGLTKYLATYWAGQNIRGKHINTRGNRQRSK
jgi:NAD(P)-dependent dehydrogenase (short-subunit alcohol dehydrogenase family)